ncbi:MAG: glutathione-disulfide reductase [Alphaproteobacteria bacterium]|nr:glutathione-disulfide reductase [Alphaproteobacteria bacterium]MBV9694931.1 glutathione-disulfide reductase [Alphaproteobacteria bacterium]
MAKFDYDLFVIGGGSGGVRASRMAAMSGARVALAEEYRMGGTCVIRGCIPKKLFVYASQFGEEFHDAEGYGWSVGERRFDWPTLIANKDKEIARLEGLYRKNVEAAGVTIFGDRAVFEDPHTILLLNEGRRVTAQTILIATGNRPTREMGTTHIVPGADLCITSDEAFHLEKLPGRILIAGGGYVALEFAHIFHGLGAAVSLVYRGEKPLRGFDEDLRDALMASMARRKLNILLGCEFTGIEKRGRCLHAETNKGATIECDQVMLAIGRAPNTMALHVDKAGVRLGRKGEIVVNEYSRTSAPHIYAIGDVTDRIQLTPVAIHEAMCFVKTVYEGVPTSPDHDLVPSAVFTTPELATVGMTEMKALGLGHSIDVYKSTFKPLKHTMTGTDERSLFKLVVDAKSGRVLGCHIFGWGAAEIVQAAAIAIRMGAKKSDFDATIALHPTAAEELVTMRMKSYSKAPPESVS